MMGAVLALRRALHARLVADPALLALLGGPRVHDEPPRAASGPYVVFGPVEARDWSSDGGRACEQELELVAWAARPGDTAAVLAVAARLGEILHEAELTLDGSHLVNLRQTGLSVRRDARTALSRVTVRLRAVTEEG